MKITIVGAGNAGCFTALHYAWWTRGSGIERIQNFVLWHYHFGSKYDTPFWKYAKTLTFKDPSFNIFLKKSRKVNRDDALYSSYGGKVDDRDESYAYWDLLSFKAWDEGMTRQLT